MAAIVVIGSWKIRIIEFREVSLAGLSQNTARERFMAEPIVLKLAPRDPREALYHRLEKAPLEHVEALLAAYEVLQGLHDRVCSRRCGARSDRATK
jgi:hypothetical protein